MIAPTAAERPICFLVLYLLLNPSNFVFTSVSIITGVITPAATVANTIPPHIAAVSGGAPKFEYPFKCPFIVPCTI